MHLQVPLALEHLMVSMMNASALANLAHFTTFLQRWHTSHLNQLQFAIKCHPFFSSNNLPTCSLVASPLPAKEARNCLKNLAKHSLSLQCVFKVHSMCIVCRCAQYLLSALVHIQITTGTIAKSRQVGKIQSTNCPN